MTMPSNEHFSSIIISAHISKFKPDCEGLGGKVNGMT